MTEDFHDRLAGLARPGMRSLSWWAPRSPADVLAGLARAAEEFEISGWDTYCQRGAVAAVEERVGEILGAPAAWFPSGTMAQQAALRVWCDRAGTRRVAIADQTHPLLHELDGPRLLHDFAFEPLGTGRRPAVAADLAAIPGALGAAFVEVPLSAAGCTLPPYNDLAALSAACRDRGVPLHLDGARLWECERFYGRPLADLVALAESTYVSFYKGLGGLSGSCLLGSADFLEEARRWRKRMGGTLYRSTPEALAALVGLRDALPLLPDTVDHARALAAALVDRGLTVNPAPPHTNTFEVFATGDPAAVGARVLDHLEQHGVLLTGPWRASEEPGRIVTDLVVTPDALALDVTEQASVLADLTRR